MAKKQMLLNVTDYKRIRQLLKKNAVVAKAMKIGGNSITSFLVAAITHDDKSDTPEIRTKRIILEIAGDFSTDPATLQNALDLAKNLIYGDDEYSLLQIRLNRLVKEYKRTASVSEDEATNCSTVGDCVTLVNDKIS